MKWIFHLVKQITLSLMAASGVILILYIVDITLWKGMLGIGIFSITIGILGAFGGDLTISGFMSQTSKNSGPPQAAYRIDLTGPRKFMNYDRSNKQLDLNFAVLLIFMGLILTVAGFYIEAVNQ